MFEYLGAATKLTILNIVISLSNAFWSILITRSIGPQMRGEWTIAWSLIDITMLIGSFGMQNACLFYMQHNSVNKYRLLLYLRAWSIYLFVLSYLFFTYLNMSLHLGNILACSLLVGLTFLNNCYQTIILADKKLYIYACCSVVAISINVLGYLIFQYVFIDHITLNDLLTVQALAFFLSAAIYDFSCAKSIGVRDGYIIVGMVDMVKFGVMACLASAASLTSKRVDVFLIDSILGPESVGLYTIAQSLRDLSLAFTRSLCSLFNYKTSDLPSRGYNHLYKKNKNIIVVGSVSAIMSAAIIYFIAEKTINILYGTQYVEAIKSTKILAISYLPLSISMLITRFLYLHNKPYLNAISYTFFGFCAAILGYFGCSYYGLVGGAIANVVAYYSLVLIQYNLLSRLASRD